MGTSLYRSVFHSANIGLLAIHGKYSQVFMKSKEGKRQRNERGKRERKGGEKKEGVKEIRGK